jgi:hypothetical protein
MINFIAKRKAGSCMFSCAQIRLKAILLTTLFFFHYQSFSQAFQDRIPISVGYFSNFGFQPGLAIGSSFDLKTWEKERVRKQETITKVRSLFISPQIAFFSRIKQNSNYLVSLEGGYKRQKKGVRRYVAFSAGLGYMLQSQLLSFSVNLATGEHSNTQKQTNHFLVPTANIEFGGGLSQTMGWYTKVSLGSKVSAKEESQTTLFIGLGVKLYLIKKAS